MELISERRLNMERELERVVYGDMETIIVSNATGHSAYLNCRKWISCTAGVWNTRYPKDLLVRPENSRGDGKLVK